MKALVPRRAALFDKIGHVGRSSLVSPKDCNPQYWCIYIGLLGDEPGLERMLFGVLYCKWVCKDWKLLATELSGYEGCQYAISGDVEDTRSQDAPNTLHILAVERNSTRNIE